MKGIIVIAIAVVFFFVMIFIDHLTSKGTLSEKRGINICLIIVGMVIVWYGFDSLHEYFVYGQIRYSFKGLPTIIKDDLGAYLYTSGFVGIGVALATYNALSLCKTRRRQVKTPNKSPS